MLQDIFGHDVDPTVVFADILHVVFNTDGNADEPRLRLENIRQVAGEIGLKVGEYGDYFGVINIGDTSGLLKNCEQKGIIVSTEEFVSDSLFRSINAQNSKIKMLIGSRIFTEGWNSWRVSTMGLINFAKGEGSQAIQLFGRGVRLKGYEGCLKRSRKLDAGVKPPKHIELLETLTIFGVKAQYMEDFKSYLEQEGTPTNETVHEFRLPVISRFNEVKGKKLHVIKVKDGATFKQQARSAGKRQCWSMRFWMLMTATLWMNTPLPTRSSIRWIQPAMSWKPSFLRFPQSYRQTMDWILTRKIPSMAEW